MIDTILLDAGGVILDETEFERVRGEVAVGILAPMLPGDDMDVIAARAVGMHTIRVRLGIHAT